MTANRMTPQQHDRLEHVLLDDARAWRESLPAPADLDAAMAGIQRSPGSGWTGRRLLLPLAAAAVVIILAGTVAALTHRTHTAAPAAPSPAPVPSSITVQGKRVPFVGDIPWADAVLDPKDHRSITVYADGDALGYKVCGLPYERVFVSQTASAVSVTVAGYATPLPAGTACGGVGHGPQAQRISLSAPLGTREFVDASNHHRHPVLDPATVPTISVFPRGLRFVAQPVIWQETSSVRGRTYASPAGPRTANQTILSIARGTPADMNAGVNNDGSVVTHTVVDNVTATIWTYQDQYQVRVTIEWQPHSGHEVELFASTPPHHTIPIDDLIATARSVK